MRVLVQKCSSPIIMFMCMLIPLLFTSCSKAKYYDNTPVKAVNLERYLGDWYEIARYDHQFERDLSHCKANYTLNDDGTIKVTNSGIKDGETHVSEGKAKTTDNPGILRVSFFGPFYSDYRILLLANDYSYALVGSKSNDLLWILARKPYLSIQTQSTILEEISRRGYKTEELIWVDQS